MTLDSLANAVTRRDLVLLSRAKSCVSEVGNQELVSATLVAFDGRLLSCRIQKKTLISTQPELSGVGRPGASTSTSCLDKLLIPACASCLH